MSIEETALEVLEAIELTRVFNETTELETLVGHLDLVRQHKAFFEGRFITPHFLSEHADIVVSHQWENPLNYFYFDVAWLGWPLIHNAPLCSGLGYYYEGFDVAVGAAQLDYAIAHHDQDWQAYTEHQQRYLSRYLATNPELIRFYDALLVEALSRP